VTKSKAEDRCQLNMTANSEQVLEPSIQSERQMIDRKKVVRANRYVEESAWRIGGGEEKI
jgi:hypothetical protein